ANFQQFFRYDTGKSPPHCNVSLLSFQQWSDQSHCTSIYLLLEYLEHLMAPGIKSPNRRSFLKTSAASAAASIALPTIIPSSVIGRDGATPPSEHIIVSGIGIGNRGSYDQGCYLEQSDVQFAAVCDIKQERRLAVKKRVDDKQGNQNCGMIRDYRELLDRS